MTDNRFSLSAFDLDRHSASVAVKSYLAVNPGEGRFIGQYQTTGRPTATLESWPHFLKHCLENKFCSQQQYDRGLKSFEFLQHLLRQRDSARIAAMLAKEHGPARGDC